MDKEIEEALAMTKEELATLVTSSRPAIVARSRIVRNGRTRYLLINTSWSLHVEDPPAPAPINEANDVVSVSQSPDLVRAS